MTRWLGFACLLLVLLGMPVQAQVYKYKDASGKWIFSDKPPAGEQSVESFSVGQRQKTDLPDDLAEMLKNKFSPQTVIETATLAVVKVESGLGVGSGFFVTNTGFLVTNRHVIRPTDYKGWQEDAEQFDEAEQSFKEAEQRLEQRAAHLARMKKEIEGYEASVSNNSGRQRSSNAAEWRLYKDRYTNMKSDYDQAERKVSAQRRKFSSERFDFNSKANTAKYASQFKIILKNGMKLNARLVKDSKEHDLALLKLDYYVTPFLSVATSKKIRQGAQVYAIGSPLGMKDFVTSGIITGLRSDKIVTDTQILPGNSGGPLLDLDGSVIGVNTLKLHSNNVLGEGFGLSVPIKVVIEVFAAELKPE